MPTDLAKPRNILQTCTAGRQASCTHTKRREEAALCTVWDRAAVAGYFGISFPNADASAFRFALSVE